MNAHRQMGDTTRHQFIYVSLLVTALIVLAGCVPQSDQPVAREAVVDGMAYRLESPGEQALLVTDEILAGESGNMHRVRVPATIGPLPILTEFDVEVDPALIPWEHLPMGVFAVTTTVEDDQLRALTLEMMSGNDTASIDPALVGDSLFSTGTEAVDDQQPWMVIREGGVGTLSASTVLTSSGWSGADDRPSPDGLFWFHTESADYFGSVACVHIVTFYADRDTRLILEGESGRFLEAVQEDSELLWERQVEVDFTVRQGKAYATVVRVVD